MGQATALGGDNPFGVRLVSALAGAATVLGVWWLGRPMLGPRGGTLAGLIQATAPIAVAEVEAGDDRRDPGACSCGCQFASGSWASEPSRPAAAMFWFCLSLAILIKGPVGPALIAAASATGLVVGLARPAAGRRLHWRKGLDQPGGRDASLVRRHQHRLARRVPSVRGRQADRASRRHGHGGPRRFPGLLPGRSRPWSSIPGRRSCPAASRRPGSAASPIPSLVS